MQQTQSIGYMRKKRLYTALPLLVLPFLTLLFWTLGGGSTDPQEQLQQPAGFNFNLPDAYLADKSPLDKLGFYEQAEKDSLLYQELIRNDPYYQPGAEKAKPDADSSKLMGLPGRKPQHQSGLNTSPYSGETSAQEQQVYQKLDQLNAALNASTDLPANSKTKTTTTLPKEPDLPGENPEIARIQALMQDLDSAGPASDPELDELNGMLEKILDIQHPERVQQKLKETSKENKGQVFSVAQSDDQLPVSSLDNSVQGNISAEQNGFYSLDEQVSEQAGTSAIQAVVHQTQELANGSTVKLRLVNDVYVNGVLIPKDNFLYGTATLDGERLKVQITSFRYQNALFPVALSVVDLDGLDGIHIPGAISRDAAKQSSEQAIQGLGIASFNQSLGAQAANAGIELTRNLLSKKVRLIRVTVKAGYQVLLRDQKQTDLL